MSDDLGQLAAEMRDFVKARGWERFHTPKSLTMALSVEAAELMEHFQWLSPEESDALTDSERVEVGEEIADVLHYLLLLADRLEIDVARAVRQKMAKNAEKYPLGEKAAFERS